MSYLMNINYMQIRTPFRFLDLAKTLHLMGGFLIVWQFVQDLIESKLSIVVFRHPAG